MDEYLRTAVQVSKLLTCCIMHVVMVAFVHIVSLLVLSTGKGGGGGGRGLFGKELLIINYSAMKKMLADTDTIWILH